MTARRKKTANDTDDFLYDNLFVSKIDIDIIKLILENIILTEDDNIISKKSIEELYNFVKNPDIGDQGITDKKMKFMETNKDNIPYIEDYKTYLRTNKKIYNEGYKHYMKPLLNRFYSNNEYWRFSSGKYIFGNPLGQNSAYAVFGKIAYDAEITNYVKDNIKSIVKMYQIMLIMKNNPGVNLCDVYFFDDDSRHLPVYNFWIQTIYPEMKFINIIGGKSVCAMNMYQEDYFRGLGLLKF